MQTDLGEELGDISESARRFVWISLSLPPRVSFFHPAFEPGLSELSLRNRGA